mgnify:CR=1 FL=1
MRIPAIIPMRSTEAASASAVEPQTSREVACDRVAIANGRSSQCCTDDEVRHSLNLSSYDVTVCETVFARLHHLEALLRDLPELFHSFEVELQFWEKGEELDAGEHAAREVVRGTLHKIAKRFATWREDHGLATVPDRADTVPYQETWHRLVGTVATHDPQLADAIHSVQRAGYTYRGERLRKADVIVWRRPREDPAPVPSSAPEGPEAANEDLGGPADGQPDRPIE